MHKFRACHAFVQRLKDVWKMADGGWGMVAAEPRILRREWGRGGGVIGKRGFCLNDDFRLRYFSLCAFDGVC